MRQLYNNCYKQYPNSNISITLIVLPAKFYAPLIFYPFPLQIAFLYIFDPLSDYLP